METQDVHINRIRVGDTIIHNNVMKTVSANNIKWNPFMGVSIFGDTYNLGYKLVTKVTRII